MQTCMQRFPTLYNKEIAEDDEISQAIEQSESASAAKLDQKQLKKD